MALPWLVCSPSSSFLFPPLFSSRLKVDGASTVGDKVVGAIGTLGENIVLRRAALAHTKSGLIGVASHGGTSATMGRLATLLQVDVRGANDKLLQAADPIVSKVAKHVIGMNPATVADLLEQSFLFEQSIKVGDLLEREGKRLGTELRVVSMLRYSCGEVSPVKKD